MTDRQQNGAPADEPQEQNQLTELEKVKGEHARARARSDRALTRHRAIVDAFRKATTTVRHQRQPR